MKIRSAGGHRATRDISGTLDCARCRGSDQCRSANRAELAPRLHPDGRIEQDQFVLTETGRNQCHSIPRRWRFSPGATGRRPAHSLGAELAKLESSPAKPDSLGNGSARARAHAFDHLVADVSNWRDGPVRARWLDRASTNRRSVRKIRPHHRPALSSRAISEDDRSDSKTSARTNPPRASFIPQANPDRRRMFPRMQFHDQ